MRVAGVLPLFLVVSALAGTSAFAERTRSQKLRGAEATRLNRLGFRKPDGSQFARRDIVLPPRKGTALRTKGTHEKRARQREVTRFIAEFVSDDGPRPNEVKIISAKGGTIHFTAPGFDGEISTRREEGWVLDHSSGKTTRIQ